MTPFAILEQLSFARRVADYADRLGVRETAITSRAALDHLGAVLADAVLQAGLNYRTVVRMRIQRIQSLFPDTATLPGLIALIERERTGDFLLWNHPTKIARFVMLTRFVAAQDIKTTRDLKRWLCLSNSRSYLLGLNGVGPKTYDYLCCLVGIDCIAVDRHIKTFASEAGVFGDYECLKVVVSYAADLLNMTRRDFDAWIWRTISNRTVRGGTLSLS